MQSLLFRFVAPTLLAASLAASLAMAQNQSPRRLTAAIIPLNETVRGEATFRERIALPPGAMLHVSLIGRVAGAEYLPLATAIVPARTGTMPFALTVPTLGLPAAPYRLQAWIIGDNRALFVGRDAQTSLDSLEGSANIALKMAPALQNIDGIGDGTHLGTPAKPKPMTIRGTVQKLDRRALDPDSRIEIEVRDVSLADAPSKLVMGQVIQLEGGQLPRDFTLKLRPDDFVPNHRYALSARVLEANKLTYLTDTLIEIAPDKLDKPFVLKVVPATP